MSLERTLNNQFSRKLQDIIILFTSLETKLDVNNTALADIKAELMWANNHINPTSIAHSHLLTHTKLDAITSHLSNIAIDAAAHEVLQTGIKAELMYANNAGTNETLAHSLVAIKNNTAP